MKTAILLPMDGVREICCRYDVAELSIFGSVLRGDFRPDSDVDFLVAFQNDDYGPWASKLTDMEADLSRLLGRKVDLVSRRAVETSENYIRRRRILDSREVVYVA
jgi:hypothetical protein